MPARKDQPMGARGLYAARTPPEDGGVGHSRRDDLRASRRAWARGAGDDGDHGGTGEPLVCAWRAVQHGRRLRSAEHTSELQSLLRIPYAVFCSTKIILLVEAPNTTRTTNS